MHAEKEEGEMGRPKCLDYIGKSLWGKVTQTPGQSKVGVTVCQVGTKGCWENMAAKSVLIC